MDNLKDIVNSAKECEEILKKAKTVEDVIELRRIGVPEDEVVRIDIGDGFNEYDLHKLDPEQRIYGITIEMYGEKNKGLIDYPTLYWVPGNFEELHSFCFDLYDDYNSVVIEEVTLAEVEDVYKEYVSKNCYLVSGIEWDTKGEEVDLPTERYLHKSIEDISSHLELVYGVTATSYIADRCDLFESVSGNGKTEKESEYANLVYVLTGRCGETEFSSRVYEDREMAITEAKSHISGNVLKENAETIVSDGISVTDTDAVLDWAYKQKMINRYDTKGMYTIYTTYENPDNYHEGLCTDERWSVERCLVIKGENNGDN